VSRLEFLCPSETLPEGEYHELHYTLERSSEYLVATRIDGIAKAWYNCCPHAGRPLNYGPDLFLTDPDKRLVCAAHGAVFDPRTGQCVSGPCARARLTPCPITERDGKIYAGDPS